jgi:hypothetical protein
MKILANFHKNSLSLDIDTCSFGHTFYVLQKTKLYQVGPIKRRKIINYPPASEASRGVYQKWAKKISPTRTGSGSGVTL